MGNTAPFVGIDFGTSKSSMAWYNPRTGQAEIIKNAEGEEKTPSVVYFGEGEPLVGTPAEQMLEDETQRARVVVSVKRKLASRQSLALAGRHVTPVDVAAEILKKLRHDAEAGHFHEPVERAVITCPAAFDQLQRDLIAEAARRAGFRSVELLDEPVAAALAYAHAGLKVGNQVLVYDLGGGTFDLAVLARDGEDGPYELALPPRGERQCGGDDFDQALYAHCDELAQQTLGQPLGPGGETDLYFLRVCRLRKENLSARAQCELSSLLAGGKRFRCTLDRSTFEGLITQPVERTVRLTRELLEEAKAQGQEVDTVVLIGGSAKLPLVQRLLT
jgi:molecular chaperone DnaK (HSP70)